jgi:hypothetical protein
MVLNISGIDKLVGEQFRTRTIQKVSEAKRYGPNSDCYVFHFAPILINGSRNPRHTKQWEDSFEVYLYRHPNDSGIYELFWMGLHGVTCQELYKEDIVDYQNFIAHLGAVVERGRNYWRSL